MTSDKPSPNPAYVRDTLSDDWKDIGFVDDTAAGRRLAGLEDLGSFSHDTTPVLRLAERPLMVEMAEPDHDFAELQRRQIAEADLNLRLMEAGAARIVANPTGRGVEIQLDRRKIRDPALEAELIRQRVNARLTAQGVGPRLLGARSPGPVAVAEVIHRVRDCPDCAAGKHGN